MMERNRAHGNGVHGREKAVDAARITLLVMILLAVAPAVNGLSIDVSAPEAVKEGELLAANFTIHNATGNVSEFIYRDGELVKEGTSFEWQTGLNDSGTYTFKFVANATNELAEEERVVEVLDNPATLSITSPPNDVITEEELRISVETSTEMNSCSYSIDGGMSGSLNEGDDEWYKVILLGKDKVYNLTVECSSDAETASKSRIFILDTTPPAIKSKSPDGSYSGTPVPVEVETNENSVCKYSQEDMSYGEMEVKFSQTGGTSHKQLISVQEQKDYTYHVLCKDRHGNEMSGSEEITFFANLKPTAKINIEGDQEREDLLNPDTYQVEVTTSEPVINPTLEYGFSKDRNKKSISLEGSGTEWEGFIAIGEDIQNDVGTFSFRAEDETGLVGTQITSGKIFRVDTEPPEQIDAVEISRDGLNAKLEWSYEGEAVDHFEIYRDTTPDVDRLDKWAETSREVYIDETALLGKKYFYKVAAVDKAGNVGELSKYKAIKISVNESKRAQSPEAVRKLNQTQELLKKKLFRVENSLEQLQNEDDRAKLQVIRQLDLVDKAKQAKSRIQEYMDEIDKLKLVGLSPGEAEKRIGVFIDNSEESMGRVVEEITVVDNTRQDQTLLEGDIEESVNQALLGFDMTSAQKQDYMQRMKNLQDRVSVTMEATTAKVKYIKQVTPQEMTLIHKKVLANPSVEEAMIVETIPKSVARRDSEVSFGKKPTVLKPDPVVKWESKELTSRDIYYHVDKLVDFVDVRDSNTVVLEKPGMNESGNDVTGAVAGPEKGKSPDDGDDGLFTQVIVFLGVIIAGSLLVYYVAIIKEGDVRSGHHNIIPGQHQRRAPPQRRRRKPKKRHPKKAIDIHRKLREAHDHADDVKYEEALQLYKGIINQLEEEEGLHDKYRDNFSKRTKKLYDKLMIVLKIRKAHHAVDTKDLNKLKDTMLDIKKLYHGLEGESELAEHARKSYSYFIDHLKGLDREEFFNNLEL